ncbi:PFL_4669 family integrating conjugative element protein [Motilimonas eburnea]|uniref:PFL_4669 family integrating conjugative element protein n=1 Tax=Motilimonas eburnea TaxID=1737488 RepID=UPI001E3EB079|nr:TIGR03761 family integrating conjugative element protein [Motilimonas eburnea]MCE2573831.1 TIGR03761 family integrating conjugative element protein [Motilimonas eburnea]
MSELELSLGNVEKKVFKVSEEGTQRERKARDEKVGALTSEVSISLQTKQIYSVWVGKTRKQAEQERKLEINKCKVIHSVMGVPSFFKLATELEAAIKQDDPFADYVFYQLHEAINLERHEVKVQVDNLNVYISDRIPSAMSMTQTYSVEPANIPLNINSRIGFVLVYLVLEVDELVKLILLGKHCSLISDFNARDAVFKAKKRIRRVINLVHRFKKTEVTRDDVKLNSTRAKKAFAMMSNIELPVEFINGTKRSPLAPAILSVPDFTGILDNR